MIIYKPTGKAREYSPLAFNPYTGCSNGCAYCYMPGILRKSREEFKQVEVKENVLKRFERACFKLHGESEQVLMSFGTDIYNELEKETRITRKCLQIAFDYSIPISILTKNALVLRDIDIFKLFGSSIQVGMTLTFSEIEDSLKFESGTAMPEMRLEVFRMLKDNNIRTWASFEPVIYPEQSLIMMSKSLPFVDLYKIGTVNNFGNFYKNINWTRFLSKAVALLRSNNKKFYIKESLRKAAPDVKLLPEEIDMDRYNITSKELKLWN